MPASSTIAAARCPARRQLAPARTPLRVLSDMGRGASASTPTTASTFAGSNPASPAAYLEPGPYSFRQLPGPLSILVGQGSSGPLDCTVRVLVPQDGAGEVLPRRWPLVVLSAGFLLRSELYDSYARDLASWGFAVALYDLPEITDDVTMVTAITSIVDMATRDPRVAPHVDAGCVLLAGHSRGGKLSALAAASDPRVRGVGLLDPVDVTGMTPMGPNYPSALPAMRVACGPPRRLPALVVGAALNGDVIPADGNFRRFASATPGPCWLLELRGAGHLQFLDMQVGLFAMLSKSGPTPDELVRRISKAALVAWARELAAPLARGEPVDGQQAMDRLQQTAAAAERLAPLSYSLKGFEPLGAAGSVSGSSAGSSGSCCDTDSPASSSSSGGFGSNPFGPGGFDLGGFDLSGLAGAAGFGSGGFGAGANWGAGSSSGASTSSSSSSSSTSPSSSSASSSGGARKSWSSSWSGGFKAPEPSSDWDAYATGSSSGTASAPPPPPPPPPPRSGPASSSNSYASGSGSGLPPVTQSYEQLMTLRAKELKAILVDRGVDCSDCFEKADLAKRIVERCR
ncbi:hypothetical protein HYH02_011509 [Chlamydomonas schloesseri]|uniref:ARMET C-terminal domain-containing protein n=1 Tax=Chlamydomonas schloesseri TaxID=2026947 RepID=A0A835W0Z8_9CHLO|nr:hypothetical protein HYH02_011509 [Chlamydomonas schloesseri]|eukprot:KAG2436572.1 hypothetical protein HYH02_011509 [Chlamydomonas schloesseri]